MLKNLGRDREEAKSISRKVLKGGLDRQHFASLTKSNIFPAYQFSIKPINKIVPKPIKEFGPQRED